MLGVQSTCIYILYNLPKVEIQVKLAHTFDSLVKIYYGSIGIIKSLMSTVPVYFYSILLE